MSSALRRVLEHFEAAHVPVIVLKGAHLSERVYPHPALRPFHDLDLLVRRDDRLRADAALLSLGYRRSADEHSWAFDMSYDGATVYDGPGDVRVDLHWSLLTEPRYAWSEAEARGVWERAPRVALAGTTALVLAREDLVLALAAHLAIHHALAGALWYWDLALLVEGRAGALDWDVLLARARDWRVERALGWALAGVAERFGVGLPPCVQACRAPRGPRAALLRRLLRDADGARLSRLQYLLPLLLVDRGRDAAGALGATLWPTPAWVRARYDGQARTLPAQYAAHYRRLAGLALRAGGALVRRGGRAR